MRKLIVAISTLALVTSAAFADVIADRKAVMKENGRQVGVLVKEFRQRVSVIGAVQKPGVVELTGPKTVL
jgi:protein involved in polysaccharide export with SLBB domain